MAKNTIFRFYVELVGYKPKMWRRLEVSDKVSLARLGYILITIFEMKANHSFEFSINMFEDYFAIARFSDEEEWEESSDKVRYYEITNYRIKDFLGKDTKDISFMYDFGDSWELKLKVEEIYEVDSIKDYPRVIEGEGFGIIEDCGGVYGLMDMLEIFQTKSDGYEEYADWLGMDELDLSQFDIDDMNFRLKKLPRIFCDIYEYGMTPTQRSIDILERRYLDK